MRRYAALFVVAILGGVAFANDAVRDAVDADIVESIGTGHISLTVVCIGLLVVLYFGYRKMENEREAHKKELETERNTNRIDKKEIREYFKQQIDSVVDKLSEQNKAEHSQMQSDIKSLEDRMGKVEVEIAKLGEKVSSLTVLIQNGK